VAKWISAILTLGVAGPAAWWVHGELASFFKGFVPIYGAVVALVIVYVLFYFLLIKPVVNQIADRFFWVGQGRRHVRMGTGLDEVPRIPMTRKQSLPPSARASLIPPTAPAKERENPDATCRFCGKKGGEICPACAKEWNIDK